MISDRNIPEPFYTSDLTDLEWQIIDPMLLLEKQRGKRRQVDLRQVVNAIFYRADNGIKWRAMPINFPAWQAVYKYYRKWVKKGLWENARVLCRDYEVLPENHEGMICVVMIRLMLRRLSNNRRTRTYKTA